MVAGAEMTAIQLCCGAGGGTLGFERAGIETLQAFDVDPVMVDIHKANFPDRPCAVWDIRDVNISHLPGADVWVCGIPCEPFSEAGKRMGHTDARDISFEVVRLIREIGRAPEPRFIFLENVPLFRSTLGASLIRAALGEVGFRCVLEAVFLYADYGVPQMRRRWHIIASRQGPAVIPQPTHSEQADLFGALPWVRFGMIQEQGGQYSYVSVRALKGIFRRVINNAVKFGNAYAPKIVDSSDVLPTVVSAWRAQVNGTTPLIYCDDGRLRVPTLLEARRAQGFPDDFVLRGNRDVQWRAVGQAIAPPFAEAVGKAIISSDNSGTGKTTTDWENNGLGKQRIGKITDWENNG